MRPLIRESCSHELLLIAGTRPEALKLEPLAAAWRGRLAQCWTGQQPDIPVAASSRPWRRLAPLSHPMRRADLVRAIRLIIGSYLRQSRPAAVVVQGDTASAYAGALAAQEFAIPVVHLEAGLRTHDLRSPFPEEAYRRNITRIAALHLAPSALAVQQLLHEGIRLDRIAKIGSTAIDGLRRANPATANRVCDLLVDIHRRENSGRALRRLVDALNKLALSGWRICIAEQPNENWNERWSEALGETCCLTRLPQLDREGWLAQSSASRCVLSDSGAAAEELPYLGVPLLIYRRCCERPEAILSGHARLLSPQAAGLLDDEIENCLRNEDWPPPWPFLPTSPYGDGLAGMRAASVIAGWLPNARQSIRAAV